MAATNVLVDFGIKVITKESAKIIKSLEILLYPPVGFVSFYNDTNSDLTVDTFDQNDALRWVSYERRIVAPHQAALLAAMGHTIHVHILGHGEHKYDCDKGQAYLYDGENVYPKIS